MAERISEDLRKNTGYFTPANQPEVDKYGAQSEKPDLVATLKNNIEKWKGNPQELHSTTIPIEGDEFGWEKMQAQQENSYFDAGRIKNRLIALSWVKEVEDYCQQAGITPQVLIEAHKHQNKPYKSLKHGLDEQISKKPSQSEWRKKYVADKTGYKS